MRAFLAAFLIALLFGFGLALAGMTDPSKVIGFLDITGHWDASLLATMLGALLVHGLSYKFITKRRSPVLDLKFEISTRREIDWRLTVGSAIFGAGWGLAGICPGPALVAITWGNTSILIFALSMIIGVYLHDIFNKKFLQAREK